MHMTIPARDFTGAARKVMDLAAQHAVQRHAAYIEPEHLLLGLLDMRRSTVRTVLTALRVDLDQMRQQVATDLPPVPPAGATTTIPDTHVEHVLQAAMKEANHLGHYQIDALHLLMGILYENESRAAAILREAGISLYDLRQQIFQRPRCWRHRAVSSQLTEVAAAINPSPVFLIPLGIMVGCGLGLFFGSTTSYVQPLTILFVIAGWIVSVCIHEFGHAIAAYLGGDQSVKGAGYLSLNPLKYTHPLLSIIIPLVFILAGGIGLPGGAVYINMHALRSPSWRTIVSAAGPLGTLLFCGLLIWPFFLPWEDWVTPANYAFWPALAVLAFFQITALIFSLLPVPPLDGFGMVEPYLPPEMSNKLRMFGNLFLMVMFMLLWQDTPIASWFWSEIFTVVDAFHIPLWLVGMGFDQFNW